MSDPGSVSPVTPARLGELVLDALLPLLDRARADGTSCRLAVDGAVHAETGALADRVATLAAAAGVPVQRVRATDFLHRRSVRLEHGSQDVDSAYERWFDRGALLRDVLEPLADPSAMTWLPALWDADADRPARQTARSAPTGSLAVVDGPYLLRWELVDAFDATVHLLTSEQALHRRFPADGDPRPAAWQRYLLECSPAERADLVVRHDHPERPAVFRAASQP